MMSWVATACVILMLVPLGARAETALFVGGVLEIEWAGSDTLSIRVTLDPAKQTDSASAMWVLTLNAWRFKDGIRAWQVHLSPVHQSVIVIPNDFLATQRLALTQVEVEAAAPVSGKGLDIRVPRRGPIPELVAPGDTLELHALWIQQEPLLTVRIPELLGGAGGETGRGADVVSPYVPAEATYTLGDPIRHSFVLLDPATGQPAAGYARIALVHVVGSGVEELAAYEYSEAAPDTGAISYEFQTHDLAPGTYDLIVWVDPPGDHVRLRVSLISAQL